MTQLEPEQRGAAKGIQNGQIASITGMSACYPKDSKMDFTSALQTVGGFGLYQKLLSIFVYLNLVHVASRYWIQIFILTTPKHWCKIEETKLRNDSCTRYDARSCYYYAVRHQNRTIFEDSVQAIECQEYADFNNLTSEGPGRLPCTHGWEYDFSELYPTYATENNWVCEQEWRTYGVHTAFWIGSAAGFLIWGLMADKFGRRTTLYFLYALNIISAIATISFSDGIVFTVVRFFLGFTLCPTASLSYTMSVEYVDPRKRGLMGAVVGAGWMTGYAGAPWMAYLLRNWKLVVICPTAIPIVLFIWLRWVPESASWLLTCGREEETKVILTRIGKMNSSPMSENFFEKTIITSGLRDKEVQKQSFLETTLALMKSPVLRKRTLILLLLSFFVGFYCNGTLLHVSKLDMSFFMTYTVIGIMEFPSSIYSAFLLDRIGRRWSCFVTNLTGGVLAISLFLIPNKSEVLVQVLDMLVCLAFVTSYNMLFQFAVELFPTAVRARGYCLKRLFGELGGCAGSITVYLTVIDPLLPQLVYGILCATAAFLVLFLPETSNQPLPITIEEGEKFGIDQKFTYCPCLESLRSKRRNKNNQEHCQPNNTNIETSS